jgi:hypothetical protein
MGGGHDGRADSRHPDRDGRAREVASVTPVRSLAGLQRIQQAGAGGVRQELAAGVDQLRL